MPKLLRFLSTALLIFLTGCQMFSMVPAPATTDVPHVVEAGIETPTTEVVQPTAEVTTAETSQPTATPLPVFAELSSQNIASIQLAAQATVENPNNIVWSQDSSKVAVLSTDGFSIFNAESGALLKSIVLGDPYRLLDASIAREWIAVTTDQETVEFRSMDTGEVMSTLDPDDMFQTGQFSPDGYNFLITSSYDIAAKEWDIETGQLVKTVDGFQTAAPAYNARYDKTGKSLIWTARATVQVYDLELGEFGAILGHEDFVNATALAPNRRLLAATTAGTIDGEIVPIIRLWDAFGGQILADIPTGESIGLCIDFSADGNMVALGGRTDLTVWQVQDQLVLLKTASSGGAIRDIKFSPDGKALAIVDESGSLRIMRFIM
jgi:WD40 repeat protein